MTRLLSLLEGDHSKDLDAAPGQTILEALVANGDSGVDAPCGGKGLCGKCRVHASGELSPPLEAEREILTEAELEAGLRLACEARILGRAQVRRLALSAATIVAEGPALDLVPDPPTLRLKVFLPPPRLEVQASDEARVLEAVRAALSGRTRPGLSARAAPEGIAFSALPGLARAAREGEAEVILSGREILSVSPAAGPRPSYGLGVDIGTTTVVAYLLDLDSGALAGTRSALNDQRSSGADVISRIAYTLEAPEGLENLRSRIAAQLSSMAASLLATVGAEPADLLTMAIAGNTTMLHLLAGVPPSAIAAAPFSPAFTSRVELGARDLGLEMAATTRAYLLPGVSAYVGADIVAGIAALGMAERDETSLLLDIGTNGELALGGSSGILCCATAAGPAFEGAGISMGMGGVEGAVDSVWLDRAAGPGGIGFSTIGGAAPRGLCGSGVLDALAVFLDLGLVDDTGRIVEANEADALGRGLSALITDGPAGPRLAVGGGIFLTQADVRSLQLAVAAIAAGIDVLLARAGKAASQVDRVFLAGGFGSYLEVASAVRVGLLPRALADRIVVAGNTSGAGAAAACLSLARLEACDRVRGLCSYVELSSQPDFNEAYMERMMFPVAP